MTDLGTDLILPDGQLVPYDDPAACARALDDLRNLKNRINELVRELTERLEHESRVQGKKTMDLPGGVRAVLTGGSQVVWDVQRLEQGLREAGMSDERISEIITTEISYKVNATEAKRAAVANADYRDAVEGARTVLETRPTVKIERSA